MLEDFSKSLTNTTTYNNGNSHSLENPTPFIQGHIAEKDTLSTNFKSIFTFYQEYMLTCI